MKKYLLSFAVLLVFAGYILFQRGTSLASVFSDDNHVVVPPSGLTGSPSASPTPSQTPGPTGSSSNNMGMGSMPMGGMMGQYKNGTYTSAVEDAYYGNVQIRMTVQNGRISDVSFLQYPNDRSTSQYINSQAMPYLVQETIQSQSASVDVISGATQTSLAFIQALKDVVGQAS